MLTSIDCIEALAIHAPVITVLVFALPDDDEFTAAFHADARRGLVLQRGGVDDKLGIQGVAGGIVEQAPSPCHGIGCVARCLDVFRRTNRLARITHFLNRNRACTADQ